jgi:hypothetical protein
LKARPPQTRELRRRPPTIADEVAGALRGEIRRAIGVASQQSVLLQSIAVQVTTLTDDILVDFSAEQLSQRAHEIRGVVIHGLCVLNELQHVNGRLEALAAIRRCFSLTEEE